MQRALITVAAAVLLAGLVGASAARAGAEWCDTDPLVLVTTPGGNVVPVHVLLGVLGAEHLPAAQAAIITTGVSADSTAGGKRTKVELTVLVPDDAFATGFPVRAAATSAPLGGGTVYDSTEGTSGTAMTLTFTLDVP